MNDSSTHFRKKLLHHFNYAPTEGQEKAIGLLSEMMLPDPSRVVMIRGYAGTGKTTLIAAFVKALAEIGMESVLLAPTGRAAKVLGGYAGKASFTLHKRLYQRQRNNDGKGYFSLLPNKKKQAVFLVDEASMISKRSGLASSSFEYRDILEDLITHVKGGKDCQLILVGDNAQLPPVKEQESPALNKQYLERNFDVEVREVELTEVLRQAFDSGILSNATSIRDLIGVEGDRADFQLNGYKDIERINGEELQEELETAYANYGPRETMVVCRSNKRANLFDQQIRSRILWMEEEVNGGDLLMIVRNNYFWLKEDDRVGFIANGDIIEVLKIQRKIDLYGFRFAEIQAQLVDHPDEPEFETVIMLDTLMLETPSLSREKMMELYQNVSEDYSDEVDKRKKNWKVLNNPYLNALQVKFSYAVTCHKAQGGQWPVVFVDQGYLTEEMLDVEYLRWLYTAITRATEKLYLVNFHDRFFPEREEVMK